MDKILPSRNTREGGYGGRLPSHKVEGKWHYRTSSLSHSLWINKRFKETEK